MKIIKNIRGVKVELELIKVKDYGKFSLYEVYKNGVLVYKETYTNEQMSQIINNGNVIVEEGEKCL